MANSTSYLGQPLIQETSGRHGKVLVLLSFLVGLGFGCAVIWSQHGAEQNFNEPGITMPAMQSRMFPTMQSRRLPTMQQSRSGSMLPTMQQTRSSLPYQPARARQFLQPAVYAKPTEPDVPTEDSAMATERDAPATERNAPAEDSSIRRRDLLGAVALLSTFLGQEDPAKAIENVLRSKSNRQSTGKGRRNQGAGFFNGDFERRERERAPIQRPVEAPQYAAAAAPPPPK